MNADTIFIAAFPKAASTFVMNVLCDFTGYEKRKFAEAGMHKDIVVERVRDACRRKCVVKQHTIALPGNLRLMHRFSIRPVVLVRNIFDSLVSLSDHLACDDRDNFLMPRIKNGDAEGRTDATVRFCASFYVQFYVSWWRADSSQFTPCWVTYEEMLTDKYAFFSRLLDFYGISHDERLRESVSRVDVRPSNRITNVNRFNIGATGRGEVLSSDQRQYVLELCSFFPEVDFSRIGV